LRGFLKSRPEALPELVRLESPDVLGILEHKLQEEGADSENATKVLLEALPDYELAALNCSTVKKGYSGTLVLLRRDRAKPLNVEAGDLPSAKDEGRLITLEFAELYVVIAYVPNSGDGLKRLDERLQQWDEQLREKLKDLASKKPVVLLGDLNVAHRDVDIWNVEAPHVPKSAGTTVQERESFSKLLDAGFADGFAHMHPEVQGAFTYWSVRAGNRPKNRGLRLDYAVVSRTLLPASTTTEPQASASSPALVDAFHLAELSTGDHCPVGVQLSRCHQHKQK
jgi:exodeoxyribonuclease III